MKLYKDKENMVFKIAVLGSAVVAMAAQDSLVQKQQGLLDKLTAIQESAVGFGIEGEAKAGYTGVSVKSDQISDDSPTNETQAFSQMNLNFFARPSAETKATVKVRLHQDWQKAHEIGVNPLLIHWWSYDGRTLGRKVNFNIGHMRVGYSPLTIWQPQVELIQEPLIFKERRLEAMGYRNLIDTSARLMQGVNAAFHSGEVSVLDDVRAQFTLARLRNNAKKSDQVYFDFDREDRYLFAGNTGVSAYGASLGVNYVSSFDRMKSSKIVGVMPGDTIYDESNDVLSIQLGFNSAKLLENKNFGGGLNFEYATSNLSLNKITGAETKVLGTGVVFDQRVNPDGYLDSALYLSVSNGKVIYTEVDSSIIDDNGTALLLSLDGYANFASMETKARINYLSNNEKFASEMASTPNYFGGVSVFNSDATFNNVNLANLENLRSGSLENMYFSVYNSDPLTQKNMMGKGGTVKDPPAVSEDYRLYNNFRYAHFYRNGYNNITYQMSELRNTRLIDPSIDLALQMSEFRNTRLIDPSIDLALPYGYATGNVGGIDLKLDVAWNDAVTLNCVFGNYSLKSADSISYTKIGFGIGAEIDEIIGYSKQIDLNASYLSSTEKNGFERKTSRIMVGTNVGIWRGLSLLAGYQALSLELGKASFIQKSTESLILVGPQVAITTGAKFNFQYGLMSNKVDYLDGVDFSAKTLEINKSLVMANISVQF